MSDRTKQVLKLAAKFCVAIALLALAFSLMDRESFRKSILAAQWRYLVGVWLATVLFSGLQAYALRIILRQQDCEVGLHALFATTCVTAYYSLFLPGIVSTGVKWYILKRATGKGVNVLSSMVYNQATLSVVMVVAGLAALGLAGMPQTGRSAHLLFTCLGLAALVLTLSILALSERTGGPTLRLFLAALRPLPRWIREKGVALLEQIRVFQTAGWRFHLTVALINLIDGLPVGLLIYYLAARAAHVVVPLGALVWLCAVVFVLGKIPITVANLGVREVTVIGLLGLYGVDQSAAFIMSMVMFSGQIFLGLLGAGYQLYWGSRR